MMSSLVEVSNLKKSFQITRRDYDEILKGINFSAGEGEFVSIVGPSGSGKSTFLYCMSGLETFDSGKSILCGNDLGSMSRNDRSRARRRNASFIFQDYNLIDSMTALENVELSLKFSKKRVSKRDIRREFERFGIGDKLKFYPAQLSGGQRQRVAIVRALLIRPRVLFADEPTGALDSSSTNVVIDELSRLSSRGTTVIMVTHDLEIAAQADRAVVISDGKLVRNLGSPTAASLFSAIEAR
ncbi:ABC transporter ATP-binding protein [Corynebacterium parakroppenstedtii]|nr:ABC transporter ATP-binding protein [Corynebacterium parakroppenstedtii]MBY0792892.1 ABC transporter ATP-binding protein [Corynebacterium parakroppenstedtii]MBY0796991.1 ABC transporter ATP-binding protein [Corynebacterium parakroppenstedtii]PMC65747.1 ABC transporter ATP-binding protein [Corynebacterium kroppenstedtii]